ncbi:hypothetical protein [Fibrobacter sp. UWB11]|uniref:hypothetical protein n=1 Tax=Fibrobacter sp. UWB11 TaxID=1896202 RepID=UPI0009258EAA|nr:hypothetical protein [Fibrobacter sp. UWB11]SIO08015.1 hypothetical protein SAMN05720758_1315 [Fibrobacter sp. UWB11]
MKYLRMFLCLVALSLTACMSHVFTDTTTRLQVENKTDVTILGLDIISDDGSSVSPWIRDAVEPGEKSRVVEEDWVGTFRVRVRWGGFVYVKDGKCETRLLKNGDSGNVVNLAKETKSVVKEINVTEITECTIVRKENNSYIELDFEGGSQYLIVSQDENGKVAFKLK